MDDESDIWQQLREDGKKRKQNKQATQRERVEQWCADNLADFEAIQPWHFRITKSGVKVDIYPQRNRYHCLKTQARSYYTDIVVFLTGHFKN